MIARSPTIESNKIADYTEIYSHKRIIESIIIFDRISDRIHLIINDSYFAGILLFVLTDVDFIFIIFFFLFFFLFIRPPSTVSTRNLVVSPPTITPHTYRSCEFKNNEPILRRPKMTGWLIDRLIDQIGQRREGRGSDNNAVTQSAISPRYTILNRPDNR